MAIIMELNGKLRDARDVELAERIVELAHKKDPWAVIDELVKIWISRSPDEVQAVKIDIDDQRELTADKRFGQTLGGRDMERRFTLLFPSQLQLLIRTQYKSEDLPFDSKFFKEFAKRYPGFKVAEKV